MEALSQLLDLGAIVLVQNRITRASPLHCLVQISKGPPLRRVECAKLLIDAAQGQSEKLIQCIDNFGATAFDYLDEDDYDNDKEVDLDFILQMKNLLLVKNNQSELIAIIRKHNVDSLKEYLRDSETKDRNILDEIESTTGLTPILVAVNELLQACDSEQEMNIAKSREVLEMIRILIQYGFDPCAIPQSREMRPKRHFIDVHEQGIPRKEHLLSPEEHPLHRICVMVSSLYGSKNEDQKAISKKISLLKDTAILLVEYGVKVCPPTTDYLLHDSARRGKLEMVKFLIEEMLVDPNTKGRQGMTPLHFAARSGKTQVVKWLIQYKPLIPDKNVVVDTFQLDQRGKTALDAAKANEKQDIIDLLRTKTQSPVKD